jgi:hypothetical protein
MALGRVVHYVRDRAQLVKASVRDVGVAATGRKLLRHFASLFEVSRFYVVGTTTPPGRPATAPAIDVEFLEVTQESTELIDELTRIDEWSIGTPATLTYLAEGERCYVASHDRMIVASVWIALGPGFQDSYSRRRFTLAPAEAYLWRCQTLSSFRGRGVLPALLYHAVDDVSRRFGKTEFVAFILHRNRSSLKAFAKLGLVPIGKAGFLRVSRYRLHVLWGRAALRATRPRVVLQRAR